MNSKCKGCTERYSGCHTQCEDYKEYIKGLEEKKQIIKAAKSKDKEYRLHKKQQTMKAMRRKT